MIVGHIGSGSSSYEIKKSLRFRSSASAYLSRTPSVAGNRNTWTFSEYVKLGAIGVNRFLLCAYQDADNYDFFYLTAANTLRYWQRYAGSDYQVQTTSVFRDPSAHYHVNLAINQGAAAADRVIISVNGVRQSVTGTGSGIPTHINVASQQHMISRSNSGEYLDGYLSEINFIDGQALDPSYFGEVSAETGAWIPKKYTGTYGTNGFYLPFNDGSSLANLTADRSGNGNNWTANNISLTAGVTYDWMDDTPSNNFAVLNAVHAGRSTISNANLTASGTTDLPTIIPDSGTWYFERGGSSQTWVPPAAFPSGSGDYNFGQRPWQSTGPTGGQKALCTKNLPTGTITTSGTFSGNASTEGPFVYLNGVPTAMTINGNAVTFGNHADKLANGFKVRSSSASYNSAGSNTYSITSTGTKFKYSNAQGNP